MMSQSPILRYGLAGATVAAALGLRLLLQPVLGSHVPYATFFGAVACAAVFGGLGPGLLALILGGVAAAYFVVPPLHNIMVEGADNQFGVALYAGVSSILLVLSERQRRESENARVERDRRERAEAVEREQKQRFEVTLSSIGDGVIATDVAGRVTFMNDVAAQLTGFSRTEAVGKPIGEVFSIRNESTGAEVENPVTRAIREGRVIGLANHTILVSQDGTHRPIDDSGAPIRDASGTVIGAVLVFRDVTASRTHAAAQQESEYKFRTLAESIPQLAWMANSDGHIFWYNRRWYEYTGTTLEAMEGWGWQSVHDPDRLPAVLQQWRESIATGQPFDMTFPLRGADGVFRPFLTRVLPVQDEHGAVVRWFGTNTDISEQRAIEQALRASEDRLRLAQQVALVGTFDWNIQTGIHRWTPELEALYGLPPGGFTGTQGAWEQLIFEEDRTEVLRRVRTALETRGSFEAEWRVTHPDGTLRWLFGRAWVFQDVAGQPLRLIGVNIDITGRKQVEEKLRESDERFRRLYEGDVVGIVCADDNTIVDANDVFLQMVGFTRQDLEANQVRWRDLTPPEYAPLDDQAVAQLLATGSCKPYEKQYFCKDGTRVPVLIGATTLQRSPHRWLCFILNLTERKQLEHRVLNAQKLESVGLLAGGIAHDFNNLLVGVIGNASLVQKMTPPGEATPLIDGIIRTGEQLALLTRQMLAYSGKGTFVVEPLDVSELAAELTSLVQPSIPKKIVLHLETEPGLPAVQADRGQLQQVFMNLVLNASEAIGSAPGMITIKTGVRDIDDQYSRLPLTGTDLLPGKYVALEVHDTGSGMDETTKSKIFDPFFSTKFLGRGLGLAAVSGIVRSHKGGIGIRSEPGKGSCFTVLFPASDTSLSLPRLQSVQASQGAGTVLVVDDEAVVREVAKKTLEYYGYKVLLADSGFAAIDIFKRHPGNIHLALLDLSMPGMGGEEALPLLHQIRPGVQILISSGYSGASIMGMFAGQRVAGFLQKPYTAAALTEKLRQALVITG